MEIYTYYFILPICSKYNINTLEFSYGINSYRDTGPDVI